MWISHKKPKSFARTLREYSKPRERIGKSADIVSLGGNIDDYYVPRNYLSMLFLIKFKEVF